MPDNLPARRGAATVSLNEPLADLESAMMLADQLARSTLVPDSLLGKPANVFHILMTGQALGLHWTESIRVIYSPGRGQIGMRGSFLLSRLRLAGHTYSFTEEDESCTFKLVRGDTSEVFKSTFTIDDAIKGGLLSRDDDGNIVAKSKEGKNLPWMQWTKRMLRWRAVSDCVSFAAPEVALGFEIEPTDATPPPQAEVVLTPTDPGPPGPDTGGAAPEVSQAAQAEQLAGLDRDMSPAPTTLGLPEKDEPPADSGMGGNTDMGGNPPDASPAGAGSQPGKGITPAGRRGLETRVARAFEKLGWDPAKYKTDMLRACSMFAGRRVTSVRDLDAAEMTALAHELHRLIEKYPEETQVVALADWVEEQREKFHETDPTGYAAYEEGK